MKLHLSYRNVHVYIKMTLIKVRILIRLFVIIICSIKTNRSWQQYGGNVNMFISRQTIMLILTSLFHRVWNIYNCIYHYTDIHLLLKNAKQSIYCQ